MAEPAKVAVVMGSRSDWETLRAGVEILREFKVNAVCRIVSAHRTPDLLVEFGKTAVAQGFQVIIAGAGGAAHLPGMLAAHTPLPVIGVPVKSSILNGVDSLLSIVQMPAGVPVLTVAIGEAGAKNAALAAISILSLNDARLAAELVSYRERQTRRVLETELPE
jgi:5-(carboxyamino)imidazole ribonucleotide mutase